MAALIYAGVRSMHSGLTGVSLTPETARAGDNADLALVNARVRPDEVESASFVLFPRESFYTAEWAPHYPGLRRAELAPEERAAFLAALKGAERLEHSIRETVTKGKDGATVIGGEPVPPESKQWREAFEHFRANADAAYRAGEFQLTMKDGRLLRLGVWWDFEKAGYQQTQSAPWVIAYSTALVPLITNLAARAVATPVRPLFPSMSDQEALNAAEKTFGSSYRLALANLRASPVLKRVVGEIRSITPALGPQWANTWLEDSLTVTFKVTGDQGEAVALAAGIRLGDWGFRDSIIVDGEPVESNGTALDAKKNK